jgi:hypothetical protein
MVRRTRSASISAWERFLGALAAASSHLRRPTVAEVQAALEAMRTKEDSEPGRTGFVLGSDWDAEAIRRWLASSIASLHV